MSNRVTASAGGETIATPSAGVAAAILPLFATTLFLSAFLLFAVQPMVARMVLPLLGGSSAVWTTAMVFFQVSLLAGYAFAHASIRGLGLRWQAWLHLAIVGLAFTTLPFALDPDLVPPSDTLPIPWLVALLAGLVGLPFFAISATAPALQVWFAGTGHPDGRDPYFLYGASNLGSLLALLGYPLVLEPLLPVDAQASLWAVGYALLTAMIGVCAVVLWRRSGRPPATDGTGTAERNVDHASLGEPIGWRQRLTWVALACVPSSLMLGVTSHLTLDVAAVPLLWVVPLALYLLTFVLVFARRPLLPHAWTIRLQPYAIALLVVAFWLHLPIDMAVPILLIGFFILTLVCHGELAARRPPTARLTEFYLWMSIGGALGGVFNALIAPWYFNAVYEFPLAIAAACLLRPRGRASAPVHVLFALAALAILAAITILASFGRFEPTTHDTANFMLAVLPVTLLLFSLRHRPAALALGALVTFVLPTAIKTSTDLVVAERSFYGVHRVKLDATGTYRLLMNGTTVHGAQYVDPDRGQEMLTYYDRSGPIGQVLPRLADLGRAARVGVVGLGSGTLACYRRPGQDWTFFEIDPTVVRIAYDPAYFDFLSSCAPEATIVLGDARLTLGREPDASFDVLIVDAFSSDAIPVHLMTREAVALYFAKLSSRGVLMVHVSNRTLDLVPILGSLADDAGVAAWHQMREPDPHDSFAISGASWVALARRVRDLAFVDRDSRWRRVSAEPGETPWTDGFSNILSAVRW